MALGRALFLLLVLHLGVTGARAAEIPVPPGEALAEAIAQAAPGDTLRLASGIHRGSVVVDKPGLTLAGEPGTVIDGLSQGMAVRVTAAGVVLRGLTVRGSGLSLIDKHSGIFLDRGAHGAVVEETVLQENLIGIYLEGPRDVTVRHVTIDGLRRLRRPERGPAISIWNAPGARILDSDIAGGRDGVFSVSSRADIIRGNRFRDLRFAVHFMYTNDSEVADNVSVGNNVGYVMMYSDRLRLTGNVSDHDRDQGLLFNFANDSAISGNVVRGAEKCVFIYNANKNRFRDNWFEDCRLGVHFTAGSERNAISGNAFVANRTQVMYVGTRYLDWAVEGRGNYWSDNAAFDLDGDGIADAPYRPNDIIDQVVWRAPAAKLLMNSPAVQVVRWAQRQFPAIHPGGVVDSAPLMTPLRPPALARLEGGQ
ncbi:Nitrous oxide reductase family maturation protein NosD [Rhodovastum atsumiense]|uniref:Nitrous oxide reductase family maturation protein NosD n=1 Tax=Rhodovastum atsumiense TaxID=504468 RepID=A0A5M6IW36_9PROT|nr:nitrous oxide reductase family maturation protein NosD [Rhodovastum atsumiense]KAA5612534.1 nitrous oxide reductase family maturation protein NosD [Rhodovastum atsumiense]CAH2601385.1 Nitrous oxide reductase family maturation protein NosD [Rhodovastum atsumiense]